MSNNYYLCPRPFDKDSEPHRLLGWCKEAVQQGRTYLRLQPAYPFIQEGLDLVNGASTPSKIQTLSDAHLDTTVRNLKELIASQSNIRVIPAFTTELKQFETQQLLLNKVYMAWQTMTFADRAIRKAWQFACAAGTGYLGMRWDPDFWYPGKGDIVLDAYGPLDILPIGLPRSHDLQKAHAVAIRVETPYHEVVNRYPEYRDLIKPSRDNSKGRGGNVISQAVKFASAALRKFGPGMTNENEAAPWAMVDVYHIYIDDRSINNTGAQILMGDPGTSWEYLVPYMGQLIPDGNGGMREAKDKDCLLYPNRRKIVCTDDVILTPDPIRQVNENWHGKLPIVQLRADDWAWAFLGFPLTRAGIPLEKANNEMMKGVVDATNVRLSPPRAFDRNTMADSLARTLNTRIPNQVVGLDLSFAGDQMKPLLPPEYTDVPALIPELIEANERRITHYMGVQDAAALARARQLPSGDTTEQLMEAMGPLIKDQSRNMESSIRDLGEMWKSLVFQFYHSSRLMQLVGPQMAVEEEFQFSIGDLIPAMVPGLPENAPMFQRARKHSGNFSFTVVPYSLHEFNSITRKLFHLQLMRSGFPVSWWTLADVFDVKNFGEKPMIDDPENPGEKREAQTELELWIAQKEIEARFMAAMQTQARAMMGGGGAPGAPGAQGGPPSAMVTPGKRPEGRPPTAQNPPAMEMKSDGRPIIRESKR